LPAYRGGIAKKNRKHNMKASHARSANPLDEGYEGIFLLFGLRQFPSATKTYS